MSGSCRLDQRTQLSNAVTPCFRFVFVASDAWGNRAAPVQGNQAVAQGAITLELQSAPIQRFEDYFLSLNPRSNRRNPWFREYWQEVHNCRWAHPPDAEDQEFYDSQQAGGVFPGGAGWTYPKTQTHDIYSHLKPCTGNEKVHRKLENQESKVQFIYDAVYAMALALHRVQEEQCGPRPWGICTRMKNLDGEKLKNYLLNISFNGKFVFFKQ